jgi:hypothetical protein
MGGDGVQHENACVCMSIGRYNSFLSQEGPSVAEYSDWCWVLLMDAPDYELYMFRYVERRHA